MELEVATMAKTLTKRPTLEELNSEANQEGNEPFARECSPSFYRRLGPLLPKHLGGKGYHMATKEEARDRKSVV